MNWFISAADLEALSDQDFEALVDLVLAHLPLPAETISLDLPVWE